jgi:hypothetical protein
VGISYQDVTQKRLKFAERVRTRWRISLVDGAPQTGFFTSLAYDAAGRPHIAYHDSAGGRLMYARRDHAVLLPLVIRN